MRRIFNQVLNSIHGGYGTLMILIDDCDIDADTINMACSRLEAFGFDVERDKHGNVTIELGERKDALQSILRLLRANGGFQTNDQDMWENYLYSIAWR